MQPKSFIIDVPQTTLDDLTSRLKNTRLPNGAQDSDWSNGTSLTYMKEVVDYWQHKYDWRKAEKEINAFDNYKVTIDGTEIHYIYQKSKKPDASAIILTHGWPDSFYRFHRVISMLSEEYDIIVPSLPGFGFSAPKAMNSAAVATLWVKLMTEVLDHKAFFAAGGDLGSGVTIALARDHAKFVKAIHLTDVGWGGSQPEPSTLTKKEKEFVDSTGKWFMTEGAYTMMHSTKPLTVAYGMNDSPAGLAAWAASFANGGGEDSYVDFVFGGRDAFLTNMTIYWITQTAGSAMQMYRENALAEMNTTAKWDTAGVQEKVKVPAAIALFPRDAIFPKEWAERQGLNVQRYTKLADGGHFAAMDAPQLFAEDIIQSFQELGRVVHD